MIKRSTRDLMWTPLKPSDGKPNRYALGWGISTLEGVAFAGHSGGQQGTSTHILIAPEKNAGVVVLANMDDVDSGALSKEILKILVGVTSDAASSRE